MDTGRGTLYTGPDGGCAARGGIALGKIPNTDDRVMDEANHHGTCITK